MGPARMSIDCMERHLGKVWRDQLMSEERGSGFMSCAFAFVAAGPSCPDHVFATQRRGRLQDREKSHSGSTSTGWHGSIDPGRLPGCGQGSATLRAPVQHTYAYRARHRAICLVDSLWSPSWRLRSGIESAGRSVIRLLEIGVMQGARLCSILRSKLRHAEMIVVLILFK